MNSRRARGRRSRLGGRDEASEEEQPGTAEEPILLKDLQQAIGNGALSDLMQQRAPQTTRPDGSENRIQSGLARQPDTEPSNQLAAGPGSHADAERLPQDVISTLQGSIGNAAVGRMLAGRQQATREAPTPVTPQVQGAIEAQRGGGEPLESGLQQEMEGLTGADLEGIRIHTDAGADELAAGLGANAFTQGRDIFLRGGRRPGTQAGRETLAHEAQHVALGSTGPGAVLREDDGSGSGNVIEQATAAVAERDRQKEEHLEAAAQITVGIHQASVTAHPSTGGETFTPTVATPGEAPQARPLVPATYDIDLMIDNYPRSFKGLTQDQAFEAMQAQVRVCHVLIDHYRSLHKEVLENRSDHKVVGFISDLLGGVDPPSIEIWDEISTGPLADADQALGFSSQLSAEMAGPGDAPAKKADNPDADRNLPEGLDLNRFQSNPQVKDTSEGAQRRAADALAAAAITRGAQAVQKASDEILAKDRRVFYYKKGTEHGAEGGMFATNVMIAAASSYGTGGLMSGVTGVGAKVAVGVLGAVGFAEEATIARQTGEMAIGLREWGDYNFTELRDVALQAAISGFIGALGGELLGRAVSGVFKQAVAPFLEKAGIDLTSKGMEYLGKLGLNWMTTTAMTPISTMTEVIIAGAKGDHSIKGWGDIWDKMVLNYITNQGMGVAMVTMGHIVEQAGPEMTNRPPNESSGGGDTGGGGAGAAGGGASPPAGTPEPPSGGSTLPGWEAPANRTMVDGRRTMQGWEAPNNTGGGATGPANNGGEIEMPAEDVGRAATQPDVGRAQTEPQAQPASPAEPANAPLRQATKADTEPPNGTGAPNTPAYALDIVNGPSTPAGEAALQDVTSALSNAGRAAAEATAAQLPEAALQNAFAYEAAAIRGAQLGPRAPRPNPELLDVLGNEYRYRLFPEERPVAGSATTPGTEAPPNRTVPGGATVPGWEAPPNRTMAGGNTVAGWEAPQNGGDSTAGSPEIEMPAEDVGRANTQPQDPGRAQTEAQQGAPEPVPGEPAAAYTGRDVLNGPSTPAGQTALEQVTNAFNGGGPEAAAAVAGQQSEAGLRNAVGYLIASLNGAQLAPGAPRPNAAVLEALSNEYRYRLFPSERPGGGGS